MQRENAGQAKAMPTIITQVDNMTSSLFGIGIYVTWTNNCRI